MASSAPISSITALSELNIPLLPLRDLVIFPNTVAPIEIGRQSSINALNNINPRDRFIILAIQKDPNSEKITPESIYTVATLARIRNRTSIIGGNIRIHAEGVFRVKLHDYHYQNNFWTAKVETLNTTGINSKKLPAITEELIMTLRKVIKETNKLPNEAFKNIDKANPLKTIDIISANIPEKVPFKCKLLSQVNLIKRAELLLNHLNSLLNSTQVDKALNRKVKDKINHNQREYYLHEKMRAIREELGQGNDQDETIVLEERINQAQLPQHALEKAQSELKKLKSIPPQSPEHSVIINYLDTLLSLPWNSTSKLNQDLTKASNILDRDHYGLEEVKSHIVEHLAVQTRSNQTAATILCLVGPPGVGKTSLAASIAKATGRQYVRMALGGVRDEAEIRGHRRTYIGSMCGKILQKMIQAKVNNPLFLLDEIDKMSMDFRGDPASALLEVLDPEQNKLFNDHYLNLDFDLSKVLFLATSNTYQIPTPLLDRMEVIELSGYTDGEKEHIAKGYLLPKQKLNNAIKAKELKLHSGSIPYIIKNYTREAGVRSLERKIAKICRKTVHTALTTPSLLPVQLNQATIHKLLGPPMYQYQSTNKTSLVGQVMGLAWNQVGGDTLSIECLNYPGKGRLVSTGKLGSVMQESIQAALSFVRSKHLMLNIDSDNFAQIDTHIHVPEGATPKDGPSAGVAIAVALASSFSDNPVRSTIAMTGEITLRGDVLAIGGLKHKLLAAKRSQIKTVLIPEQNKLNLADIPSYISDELEIITIKRVEEAFQLALEKPLAISKNNHPKVSRTASHIH